MDAANLEHLRKFLIAQVGFLGKQERRLQEITAQVTLLTDFTQKLFTQSSAMAAWHTWQPPHHSQILDKSEKYAD